ncbi:carbohydrate ABC transporter permease [Microbacterium sp. A93]|uniref:carbohydrate ABC transporter permease n=1 Tax=unclassified Microbacterium TaxID=2609290 RepID=UPI003F421A7C
MNTRTRTITDRRVLSTLVLLLGAVYCLFPVAWIFVASTKSVNELFTTFTFAPGTAFFENLGLLFSYGDGSFGIWSLNSVIYALGGALLSTLVSAATGYAFAVYDFRGKKTLFGILLAGVLIPGIVLAIPQYFLFAEIGLTDSYLAVLLPVIVSPFGIYLSRIYAEAAFPRETLEACRIDGASEFRAFRSVALPMMLPGLVTVFLLQFIGIWNNFLLPFLMLSSEDKFPITIGLYTLLNRGTSEGMLWNQAIMGSAISIVAILILMGSLQRFWKLDLLSGGVKG